MKRRERRLSRRAAAILAGLALAATRITAGSPIEADPEQLVVQPGDLPVTFAVSAGDYQPGGAYAAVYFRPELLAPGTRAAGGLLGVMAAVEVHEDAARAATRFAAAAEGLGAVPGGEAGELAIELAGAEETIALRIEYQLQGVWVVDHRYRLRIDNVVANLMVSSLSADGGGENAAAAARAARIAAAQVARIVAARGSG